MNIMCCVQKCSGASQVKAKHQAKKLIHLKDTATNGILKEKAIAKTESQQPTKPI